MRARLTDDQGNYYYKEFEDDNDECKLGKLHENTFISIDYLLHCDYANIPRIATAIECDEVDVYTFDEFNRFLKADPSLDGENKTSKGYILKSLQHYNALFRRYALGDEECEGDFKEYIDTPDYPLGLSGWLKRDLPAFDELYSNWRKLNSAGVSVEMPVSLSDPVPQSQACVLLELLLVDKFTKELIKKCRLKNLESLRQLQERLEKELHFETNEKTLRKYIDAIDAKTFSKTREHYDNRKEMAETATSKK